MPVSKLLGRLAPVFVLQITAVAAGCSAEPVAEQMPSGQMALEAAARAKPSAERRPATNATATPEATVDPRLAVEGEGLRWFLQPSGSARPIPFGRPEREVLASLEKVRGPAKQDINQDCGAGAVQVATWADGLSVIFQDDRFVGWSLGRGASSDVMTAAGIGPGSTRAELDAAYSVTVTQTSLGSEFSAGALHGVLDEASATARITDMWAGVNCVAR